MTDYPQGDGHPECPDCKGRGVVDYTPEGAVVPGTMPCKCVRFRDLQRNMERCWKGLSKPRYKRKAPTPLAKYTDENLIIRSPEKVLRKHLWRLLADKPPRWSVNVFSDADLMDAWLSRVDVEEIYDADVERIRRTAVSGRFLALVDLVEPPGLLVLRVGVKAARNSAMPEVLLEALQHRSMVDRPTWVVETPGYPLEEGHISFDYRVGEYLEDWDFLELDDNEKYEVPKTNKAMPETQYGGESLPPGWESMSKAAKNRWRMNQAKKDS